MIDYYTLEYYTHAYIKFQYLSTYFIVAQWSAILHPFFGKCYQILSL